MAHYAYVVNGVVDRVHVLANAVITDEDGVEQETLGQGFLGDLHGLPAENFIQCSYNGNFRGNYAGVGFYYDEALDAFIPPTPYDSWVLDEATYNWVAPIPYPEDGKDYTWDEDTTSWIEVTE